MENGYVHSGQQADEASAPGDRGDVLDGVSGEQGRHQRPQKSGRVTARARAGEMYYVHEGISTST